MSNNVKPSGKESFFDKNEIIVSKTDLKGRLIYGNSVFLRMAGYKYKDIIGQPHSIIRHPDMPRCVFKLLWDTIQKGEEIFAYVVNMAKNGDHYWVLAHVTPTFDSNGNIISYHSNRRVPDRKVLEETIIPLYKMLQDEENRHSNKKEGMNSAYNMLIKLLEDKGICYDQFIFSLANPKQPDVA